MNRTSYINRGGYNGWPAHNWRVDLSQRLNWLYGSAHERMKAAERDIAAWRNLGRREAA